MPLALLALDLAVLVALSSIRPAAAGQSSVPSAGLTVVAIVDRSCRIESAPLAFGDYDPVVRNQSAPLDAETTVTVTCTKGTPAAVGMNAGQHGSGSARFLANGASLLGYDLYQDASHTIRWGDSPGDMQTLGSSNGNPRSLVVYGRIRQNQDVPIGVYTDAIVATVVF